MNRRLFMSALGHREGKALMSNRYAILRHTLTRKPDAAGEYRGSTDAASSLAESTISRRSAIAAVAAVAATGSLARAGAIDPIFPVQDAFRLAEEALYKAVKDLPEEQGLSSAFVDAKNNLDEAYALFKKAQLDLLTTTPTTRAGVAALLVRLGQATHSQRAAASNGDIEPGLLFEAMCWNDEPAREAACAVLGRIGSLVLTIA